MKLLKKCLVVCVFAGCAVAAVFTVWAGRGVEEIKEYGRLWD